MFMHRRPLLDMLDRYLQRYAEEEAVIRRICELVEGNSNCFERTCRPGHVTGSAWILSPDRTQCLLLHHNKLARWLQPGGHADGQSDIVAVARREVAEETGLSALKLVRNSNQEVVPLDVDVHPIPALISPVGKCLDTSHEHHDIRFLFVAGSDQSLQINDESNDLRWFTHDEVVTVTDEPSVLRMLLKAGPFNPKTLFMSRQP
jgi:8-oxo-dGTP pyrophosphatase MutT (NUDIX family)